jgi:hypothetical protein
MSLNPSNKLDKGLKGFPTLGDPPFEAECKDQAVAELRDAGFPRGTETVTMREVQAYSKDSEAHRLACSGIHIPGMAKPEDIEWVTVYDVEAKLYGWTFSRAWYYWRAKSDYFDRHIPEDVAKELNKTFRREIRVEGYGGGTDVTRPVSGYHIDTPRGLAKLVKLLKQQDEELKQLREAAREKSEAKYMSKAQSTEEGD